MLLFFLLFRILSVLRRSRDSEITRETRLNRSEKPKISEPAADENVLSAARSLKRVSFRLQQTKGFYL